MPFKEGQQPEELSPVEQSVITPDNVENTAENIEAKNEAAWWRAVEHIKKSHIFKYGEAPEGHLAQAYIDDIVARLPKREGFPLKVHLSLDWKESNAFCLPDGTVFLGATLLHKVDSEEALAGIIAHEYVHGYKAHAKKDRKEIKSIQDALQSVGLKRAQEYEADLRACILDLEEAGISPIGYKLFLEKIHAEQETGGIVHGSSMDRALNIAGATYALDLKSLAQDLHTVPGVVLDSAKKEKPINSHFALWQNPNYLKFLPKETRKDLKKQREKLLESTPTNQLSFAIEAVYQDIAREKEIDPESKELLGEFIQRFLDESISPDVVIDQEERKMLAMMGLQLSTSVNILRSRKAILDSFQKETQEIIPNLESLEKARLALENHAKDMGITYALHSTEKFMIDIAQYAKDSQMFADDNKEFRKQDFEKFIGDWSETLSKISEQYDLDKVKSREDLEKSTQEFFDPTKKEKSQPKQWFSPKLESKVNILELEKSQKYLYDLGIKFHNEEPEKLYKAILKDGQIIKQFSNSSLDTIMSDCDFIEIGIKEGILDSSRNLTEAEKQSYYEVNAYFLGFDNHRYVPEGYFSLVILKRCLSELEQFQSMSELEKRVVALDFSLRASLQSYPDSLHKALGHASIKYLYDLDSEEDPVEEVDTGIRASRFQKHCVADIKNTIKKDLFFKDETTTPEEIKHLHQWLVDGKFFPRYIPRELKDLRLEYGAAQEKIFAEYLNHYLGDKSLVEILSLFKQLEGEGVPAQKIISKHRQVCGKLVLTLIEAVTTNEIEKVPLVELLELADWITDPFLARVYRRFLMEKYLPNLGFDEKLNIFLPKDQAKAIVEPQTQEIFFESEVNTEPQFKEIKKRIGEAVEGLTSAGSTEQGVASLLGNLGVSSIDVNEIMQNLLKSSYHDAGLKEMILDQFLDQHKETERDSYNQFSVKKSIAYADSVVRSVYNMDGFAKQLLLRKILTEKKGILPDLSKRNKFLTFIFGEWLNQKNSQKDITGILEKAQGALGKIPEWQLVYFGLQSTLRDKIAVPPERPMKWDELGLVNTELEDLDFSETEIKKLLKTTLWSKIPTAAQQYPEKYPNEYTQYAHYKLNVLLPERVKLHEIKKEKLEPIEFVKEFASKTGAIGVRFLQLLPQFVELPKQYEAKFSEVYDGLKGQSKLAALALLEREWPGVWQEMETIGKRIGGGSVMTVYETKTKSGEEEVIKVRNPNVSYHLAETHRFASQILDLLAKKYGGGYKAARGALDDIKEWIEADINFKGFIKEDKQFYEKNNGFKPEGFDYSIKVPVSKGTDNPYFIREEKVIGKNLTKWNELLADKHDMKQAISLLVKNYVSQIMDGKVHSDVHVGNFAVTDKKEVVIFDRNFFLDLSDEERGLITAFMNPFAGGAEEKLLSYLGKSSTITKEIEVKQAVSELLKHASAQEWNQAQTAIVKLKQEGVKIPLKLTLFIKNFNSLQMMAKKAGFGNLAECFLYQPQSA